jgi:TonB family protein
MSNKILLLSIAGSLLIHGIVLCMAGAISMRQSAPEEKIITLYMNPEELPAQEKDDFSVPDSEKEPSQEAVSPENTPPAVGQREDTVDLNDPSNTRYRPYLLQVRKKIGKNWSYPETAIARQIEGTNVILFSIMADGTLSDAIVSSSSGSKTLDQGSLAAIHSSAPFDVLPPSYGLMKLNIYASFSYGQRN